MTVPSATSCNRRVAPGRLSLVAPYGRGHPDPAAGVSDRRAPSRARTCAHRWARRLSTHAPVPSVPDLVGAADFPPSAAPLVLRRPRHRRRRGPVVLDPLRPRWSLPLRRPPIAPAGPRPPRPRRDRTATASGSRPPRLWRARLQLTPRRGLCLRLQHWRRQDRRGPVRPSSRARRFRLACGCRTTPTVVSGGSRPVRRERRRRLGAGVGPRRPRPPPWARAPPRRKAGVLRSRRRIGRRR